MVLRRRRISTDINEQVWTPSNFFGFIQIQTGESRTSQSGSKWLGSSKCLQSLKQLNRLKKVEQIGQFGTVDKNFERKLRSTYNAILVTQTMKSRP